MGLSNCILRQSGMFAYEVENLLTLFCSAFGFSFALGREFVASRDKFHVPRRGASALADLARVVEVVLNFLSSACRHLFRVAATSWSSSSAFLRGERDERLAFR